MEKLKKTFSEWTKFDYIWFIIANASVLSVSLYLREGFIPTIAAITGVCCVIFISKKMMINYYLGAINVALYAFLAYESKLYGDAMFNAFYCFPMQFLGMYTWTSSINRSENHEVESKTLTHGQKIILSIVISLAIIVFSLILKSIGGQVVIFDSASTILSIFAMYLMINRYVEQWYLWVIVNSITITMWIVSLSNGSGNYSTLLMWIIYLLNSLYGLYNWKKKNIK